MYVFYGFVHGVSLDYESAKSVDRDSADEQGTDSEPGLVEAGGFSICRITPELQAEKAEHRDCVCCASRAGVPPLKGTDLFELVV